MRAEAGVSVAWVSLLSLARADLPRRRAQPLPIDQPGFVRLVAETYPELEYVSQRYSSSGESVHVWSDADRGDYVVYRNRDDGWHTVMESSFPWYDALTRLAGMWDATEPAGSHR